MAALEIFLLRHGESEGNRARTFGGHGPTPLTEAGHAQARAAARRLLAVGPFDALYASDLPRAVQTAQPFADATGLSLTLTPALRERSVGVFTNLSFEDAEARYPDHYAALVRRDPLACPPGGETTSECRTRAARYIDDAIGRVSNGRVLFVSHAHTINLALRHLLQVSDDARVFFQTDNCAFHHLARAADGFWRVVALNDRR